MKKTEVQRLARKYGVTKSGSQHEVARRLRKITPHTMTLKDLSRVEDFLELPPSKRYKGERFYEKHRGSRIIRFERRKT